MTIAYGIALWRDPFEGRQSEAYRAIFIVLALSVAAVAAGTVWNVLQLRRTRRSVDRLVTELAAAPPPGGLRHALAAALGDPGLTVHYWLPDAGSSSTRMVNRRRRP